MLFTLLIGILILACVSLFAIGVLLSGQEQAEARQNQSSLNPDEFTVEIGRLSNEMNRFGLDDHRAAKLELELQARKQMADIIG